MGDELVPSLLDTYRHAPTLEVAEQALEALQRCDYDNDPPIGDLYDELAELAAEGENFELAVRAQRRAVELGCELPRLGREMLGWYLMKDGRRAAGDRHPGLRFRNSREAGTRRASHPQQCPS